MTPNNDSRMDGVHAWLVAASSAICIFLNSAFTTSSSGIYFVHFQEHFIATSSEIATITLIHFCIMVSSGPLASFLYELIGCRVTVILSGLLSSLAFLLAYFAQSTTHLLLCFVLLGIGLGIKITAEVSTLTQYFQKYQKFALAIVFLSGSIGIAYASVLVALIERYTWRGSMLIQAGIALQITICGAVMKSRRARSKPKFEHFLPFSMLKEPLVIAGCSAAMSHMCCGCIFANFITALMVERGISVQTAAFLLLTSVGPGFMSRLVAPFLAQYPKCNNLVLTAVFCSFSGFAMFAATFCHSVTSFVFVIALDAVGFGGFMSLLMVVPVELFGAERLPKFLAIASIPIGISLLLVPKFAGYLVDTFGLNSVFYLGSIFGFTTTIIYAFVAVYRSYSKIT